MTSVIVFIKSIIPDIETINNLIYVILVVRRTFEIAAEYMSDLLGSFLEFGIDFRTTVTVFVGGGTVLLKDIIDEVWKRYHSTYYVVDDPRANVKGFIKQYMAEKAGY